MLLATQCWWLAGAADWVREAIVPPAHKQVLLHQASFTSFMHLAERTRVAQAGQTVTSTAHGKVEVRCNEKDPMGRVWSASQAAGNSNVQVHKGNP